jgi:hypothetical protein
VIGIALAREFTRARLTFVESASTSGPPPVCCTQRPALSKTKVISQLVPGKTGTQ